MAKKNLLSLCLLVLLGFIWGSGYSLAKYAMTHGVPPLGYAFWQCLGPALLLLLLALFTRQAGALFNKSYWPFFLVCGLIGIGIPNTNMYFIASHLPAGILAVLVNTVPLIVYPLALIFKIERWDSWRVLALLMGMTGILLIIQPGNAPFSTGWAALALISPLAFASCSIYIALCQPKALNNLQAACGMLIMASLLLMPLVAQQQAYYPLTGPLDLSRQVVLLEILLSTIGYLIFFKLIRLAGPVFYSLTGAAVALTGLFWGHVVFAEQPNLWQSLAIGVIISAILLLSYRQKQTTEGLIHAG